MDNFQLSKVSSGSALVDRHNMKDGGKLQCRNLLVVSTVLHGYFHFNSVLQKEGSIVGEWWHKSIHVYILLPAESLNILYRMLLLRYIHRIDAEHLPNSFAIRRN